jgi:carbamoyl-phosphate synthase large subunit
MKALKLGGFADVFGADANPYHLILSEKYAVKSFKIPRYDEEGYLDKINEIIEKYEIDFVHAQSDEEVEFIGLNRKKIKAKTFLPPSPMILFCQDKWSTAMGWSSLWEDAYAYLLDNNDKLLYYLYRIIKRLGPLWIRATRGAGGRGSTLCTTAEMGLHWLKYWWSRDPKMEFMAQKYLPGRNIAWQSVWKDGELLTSQARERVEYIYPNLAPSGITGTPTVQRTLNEGKINAAAIESIHRVQLEPHGIYSVDLKENENGDPIPTEINCGRFFTTSYFFAVGAEMFDVPRANMPEMYVLAGLDKDLPAGEIYNILEEDLYWIRHIDCGHKLTKGSILNSKRQDLLEHYSGG